MTVENNLNAQISNPYRSFSAEIGFSQISKTLTITSNITYVSSGKIAQIETFECEKSICEHSLRTLENLKREKIECTR